MADPKNLPHSKPALVYRLSNCREDAVVFAEEGRARICDQVNRAINNSTTWGEFRAAMPETEYEELISQMEEEENELPEDHTAFNAAALPGWSDGLTPEWLESAMWQVVPEDLLEKYGVRSFELGPGFYRIPECNQRPLCAELEARGYTVRHAPELDFS